MKTTFTFFLFTTLFFSDRICNAQKSISAHTTLHSIKVDGELNEADWQTYLKEAIFIQTTPNNGEPSARKNKVAVLHDKSFLYIGAELYVRNKGEINNRLTTRDDIGNSDIFGVQIDPFGKAREGYDFTITAAGVQSDEKLSELGGYKSFDAIWISKVKLYDDRWTVEMKIPFNSIRFPKDNLKHFKINFQRIASSLNEESFWNPILPQVDGFLNQLGNLDSLATVDPPLNLSLYPFASAISERSPDGRTKTTLTGGIDLKYVYKNAYTLDISLIPDFSQAPSDNQIFNLTPFEIKYSENRPFFVEGTEIFDKGNFLYTRRIGGEPLNKNNISINSNEEIVDNPVTSNILNLIKLTGKSNNGVSVGVLNGVTAKSEALITNRYTNENRKTTTNPLTNYNSIVIDKNFKNNSSITFINNSVLRSGEAYDANLTAVVGKWYNNNRTYSFDFKKAISQKYLNDGSTHIGHNYFAYASKVSGRWTGGISTKLLDEKYDNNDFGFLSRNNKLLFRSDIAYSNNAPKKLFSWYSMRVENSLRYYYSLMKNEQTFIKVSADGNFKENNHTFYSVFTYVAKGKNFYEPRVRDRFFNKPAFTELVLEYQTNHNKRVFFDAFVVHVDYLKSKVFSKEVIGGYGLNANIGQHLFLKFEQDYTYASKSAGYTAHEGEAIVFGDRASKELINTLTLNYAINAKWNANIRCRHYWFQVDYKNQYELLKDGNLASSNYAVSPNDFDDNFNSFNIDFIAKWQFASASEISLGYKLGSLFYNSNIGSTYFDNLRATIHENNSNTVSLKVTYFLNSSPMKRKSL